MDRGFLFGDGVYEVVPVYGSRLFRLRQHLERMDQSLAGIRLCNPVSHGDWQGLLADLVERNGGGDQAVYLQVTRGAAAKRDHAFPPGVPPTVFVMSHPLTPIPERQREQGAAAITLEDIRWKWCHVKAVALLPNVLLRQRALDAGADEAILIRDGEVTEGAASNVCVVRGGVLATPPKGPFLLPGITRDLILELATAHGIPCEEVAIFEAELREADEVWLTSSTKEILPVTRLDDRPVGTGRPGPLWTHMYRLYQDYKQAVRTGTEE
jgi:D-alanine transaminase